MKKVGNERARNAKRGPFTNTKVSDACWMFPRNKDVHGEYGALGKKLLSGIVLDGGV